MVERLRGYTTTSGLSFVDRVGELLCLLSDEPGCPLYGRVSVVMGPRGCGKTELAYALQHVVGGIRAYKVFYVRHEEDAEGLRTLVSAPAGEAKWARRLAKRLAGVVYEATTLVTPLVGVVVKGLVTVSQLVYEIMSQHQLREARILVVLDEFRGHPLEQRGMLENLANDVALASRECGGVKVVVFTSDATATRLCSVMGSKLGWYLVWNLPPPAFTELYAQLNPPRGLSPDTVWRLVGGNPRELLELAKEHSWDVRGYLNKAIARVAKAVEEYARREHVGLREVLTQLREVVDELDHAGLHPLWDVLLEKNIGIDVDERFTRLTMLPEGEPWVGRRYAFQLPVYYHVAKTIAKNNTLDVTPTQVLEEVNRDTGEPPG